MPRTAPPSRLGATARGLAALAVLLVLLAALPLALTTVGVLPGRIPSWHDVTTALTSPDTGVLFLGTITVIGWAAWASFVCSVVVEAHALLRHRQAPRVRALGATQRMAASLVAGVVLLLPAGGAFADAPAASAAVPTTATAAITPTPAASAPVSGHQAWSGPVHQVVRGDTLWDLAEHYLGSGTRWHDIAQLNTGIRQADGTVMTSDVLDLQPGWTLRLPTDARPDPSTTPPTSTTDAAGPTAAAAPTTATGASTVTVQSATETPWSVAVRTLGDGNRWPDIAALNAGLNLLTPTQHLPQGTVLTLPADAHPSPAASSTQLAATQATGHDAGPAASAAPAPAAPQTVTVRQGDSLTAIAQQHLGDGNQWPALWAANRGEQLPDGGRFTDPDLVYPGQVLDLPAQAAPSTPPAAPSTPTTQPTIPPAAAQPAPTTPAAPAASSAGPVTPAPEPSTPTTPSPAADLPAAPAPSTVPLPSPTGAQILKPAPTPAAHTESSRIALAPAEAWLGAGALAAALLGTLALRRRLQQRRVRPGRHIPLPDGQTAATEQGLRTAQRPAAFDLLDQALRTMALHLTAIGRPLPAVQAVIVTGSRLELHLADDCGAPVKPFTAAGRPTVWALGGGADLADADDLRAIDTPYPALVSLGWTAQGHLVLIDLEQPGHLHLTGPTARHVLQALAVELATTPLIGHLDITVLGDAAPRLEDAVPERVERTDTARALATLGARAVGQRRALTAAAATSPREVRLTDEAGDSWTPQILLAAHPGDDEATEQLAAAVLEQPRPAAALVTAGTAPAPGDGWTLACAGPDTPLVLPGSGLTIRLQGLTDEHYADAIDLLALAASTADVPAPAWIRDRDRDLDAPAPAPATATEETGGTEPVEEDTTTDTATRAEDDGLPAEYADLERDALTEDVTPEEADTEPAAATPLAPPTPTLAEASRPGPSLADILAEDDEHTKALPRPTEEHPVPAPAPVRGPASVPVRGPASVPVSQAVSLPEPAAGPDGPSVLLLGPLSIEGAAGTIGSNRRRAATELIVYLALNPGADHHAVDEALWPGQITSRNVRNSLTSRARSWLGTAPDGTPHLPHFQDTPDNRYRLARTVTVDWDQFLRLARAGHADPGEDGTLALRHALALVRGRPLAATDPGRYAWAEHAIQGMISEITHAAHELATRCLETGDIPGTLWAARRGLLAGEDNEILHRMVFRAHHAAGDTDALHTAIAHLRQVNEEIGDVDMDAETIVLLQELMGRPARAR
ncbi:LysM peptidoglycan-binding domain-containing protein [Kitasatospora sp. NBC_01302]|uniref:LysM peptidoglycan-binding domain-containing protein n=1 Tax=Kitasatospora sp. NBC_01302 TaxID=2903575 RepID=UPI002E10EADC|nr:LysM peptidoglycan-binding domain-containing protein [Kitasatospora sp. NBC_01302]